MTSFLVGVLSFPPRVAVGTPMVVALIINLAGALFHAAGRHVDVRLLAIFGAGSVLGTLVGVRLATRIDKTAMTVVLGVLTIASGVYLAFHG